MKEDSRPVIFNPDQLPEPGEGYRFCYIGEMLPCDWEYWDYERRKWIKVGRRPTKYKIDHTTQTTRRTRTQLPDFVLEYNMNKDKSEQPIDYIDYNSKEHQLKVFKFWQETKKFRSKSTKLNYDNWIIHSKGNAPSFDDCFEYDVIPEEKSGTIQKIPLCKDDIPAICWVRFARNRYLETEWLVIIINSHGIYRDYSNFLTWNNLIDNYEYSSDRRDWKPCYKEVFVEA